MECNKEEAVRALQLAEKKMQNNDFTGALRIAKRAHRLFPELENISHLLTVCEVHCSAENRIGGSEMDWYGILQVEQTVDVVTIKKQYRKLALLLHPDKNKFAGAEAAFKLIGEANRVLTDQVKRSLYETKCRTVVRTAAPNSTVHQSNGNTSIRKHDGAAKNHQKIPHSNYTGWQQYQQAQVNTFWTCCPFCEVRYQYYKNSQDRLLQCQNCENSFIALNLGTQPPGSHQSQFANLKEAQKQRPSKAFSQNSYGNPSDTKFASSHPVSKAGSAVELSGGSKMDEKDKRHVDVGVGKTGVEMSESNRVKSKEAENLKNANRKGRGKSVAESSESCGTGDTNDSGDVSQENVVDPSILSGGYQPRKSSRQKRNISYRENLSDDDNDFVSPPKKPREINSSNASEENMKNASANDGVSKDDESAALDGHEKEVKQNPVVPLEEILPRKRSTAGESEVEEKEADVSDHLDRKCKADDGPEVESNAMSTPEIITCPDPEFNDFDKVKGENCFAVNQIWAIYDTVDGMPRFYARIRKVFSPGFKLRISWLEPDPDDQGEIDWCSKELPVGCGKYTIGNTEETADRLMFSHHMYWIKGRSRDAYMIYPRKGETWALFQNWDISWFSDPEKHIPYQLEYVEVVSDFVKDSGIEVAYLCKVKGFVSLFQRSEQIGIVSFHVPPDKLYRFSHRVPSFRMTGEEREGVPKGSFEFDPASLPENFFKLDDHSDVKRDNVSINTENSGFCSKSLENEEKPVIGSERIPAAKKHEKTDFKRETPIPRRSPRKLNGTNMDYGQTDANKSIAVDGIDDTKHGNLVPSDRSSPPCEVDGRIKTPRKEGKDNHGREPVELRRSPRDLNRKNSQLNAGQFAPELVSSKHSDSHKNESHACTQSSLDATSSCGAKGQSGGKGQHSKSSRKCPVTSPSNLPACKSSKVRLFDFKGKNSKEKFQLDHIWALHSDGDGLPKTYAQVKRIESTHDFLLHVALLEPCSPPKNMIQPVCCGTFRVKDGETKVFRPSSFSHCLSAKHMGKNKYEIYPREGEVWGLYKMQNMSEGEFDIVEVLEDLGTCTRVVVLTQVDGYESMFKAPRIQRSKTGVIDVPRSEAASRFSHQIQAFRHTGDSRLLGYWELDPLSVSGNIVCLD
ncbi:hypothetical protein FNV43_RR04837 [Rhamnella rubrinervis]|uniref:J domain-containing protein n=1 Tax=Rhamnella rubrinervis TaxID=2594499 RepID=A0A8K0HL39_9ROSA|nr:hypothetical protein FNV43_RR04837 [Rhamnella rubrinervis]